jgi:methanogenic corrinoid protein MtbC1
MPVNSEMDILRAKLADMVTGLQGGGKPSRTELVAVAEELCQWKEANQVGGLWVQQPLMVTATLDDAMGHGLELIHQYADLAGVEIHTLGLLQSAESVAAACRKLEPDFLGLTVLQFDSEDDLALIARQIPANTRIVAGGPVFKADPELARRVGIHRVAADAADFLNFLLAF